MVIDRLSRMRSAQIAGVLTVKSVLGAVRSLDVKHVIQDTCLRMEIASSAMEKLLTINARHAQSAHRIALKPYALDVPQAVS